MNGKGNGETGYRIAEEYLQVFLVKMCFRSVIRSFLFLQKTLIAKKLQKEGTKQCALNRSISKWDIFLFFFFFPLEASMGLYGLTVLQ